MKLLKLFVATLLAAIILSPVIGFAHHSHNNLDREDVRIYSGVVTKFGWAMPHVYFKVKVPDSEGNIVDYVIESGSPPSKIRQGWTKDSFKPGDRITWEGAHDRNKNRHYTGLKWVEKSDGTRMGTFRTAKQDTNVPPSTDFTGLWTRDMRGKKAFYYPPKGWPLTSFGQGLVDNFKEEQNPMRSCGNPGPPKSMLIPYPFTFSRPDDKTLVIERDLMDKVRVIHFDKNHPKGEPSKMGHSIGWFEGDELVVETTNFIADKWGIHTGIDSSDQKYLIERFSLSNGGMSMDVVITVTDPVYLSETKVFEHHWRKIADREPLQVPCTLEAARLYLDAGLL